MAVQVNFAFFINSLKSVGRRAPEKLIFQLKAGNSSGMAAEAVGQFCLRGAHGRFSDSVSTEH